MDVVKLYVVISVAVILLEVIIQNLINRSKNRRIRKLRDRAYDEVLDKCRAASQKGEVIYLSTDDIENIINNIE